MVIVLINYVEDDPMYTIVSKRRVQGMLDSINSITCELGNAIDLLEHDVIIDWVEDLDKLITQTSEHLNNVAYELDMLYYDIKHMAYSLGLDNYGEIIEETIDPYIVYQNFEKPKVYAQIKGKSMNQVDPEFIHSIEESTETKVIVKQTQSDESLFGGFKIERPNQR